MTDMQTRTPAVGDRVRVINRDRIHAGMVGTVRECHPNHPVKPITVEFIPADRLGWGCFDPEDLESLNLTPAEVAALSNAELDERLMVALGWRMDEIGCWRREGELILSTPPYSSNHVFLVTLMVYLTRRGCQWSLSTDGEGNVCAGQLRVAHSDNGANIPRIFAEAALLALNATATQGDIR